MCIWFKKQNDPVNILQKLYRKIDGVYISHAERDRLHITDPSFIYGEITYEGFAEILAIAKPQVHETFYDLGSGTGKAVFYSALLYDWKKCIGVEFLPGLSSVSQELLKIFLNMKSVKQYYLHKASAIEFIHADYLTIDFSDANVIFLNATTLNPVLWGQLETKLNHLQKGTRVIVSTKTLNELSFEKMHQGSYPMSWGNCSVNIYRRM